MSIKLNQNGVSKGYEVPYSFNCLNNSILVSVQYLFIWFDDYLPVGLFGV